MLVFKRENTVKGLRLQGNGQIIIQMFGCLLNVHTFAETMLEH